MKKQNTKSIKKERIKGKTRVVEKDLEDGTRKIFHSGIWKGNEVMHGEYNEYYEAMELIHMPKIICKYRYGLNHGKYQSWFEEGFKDSEGHYKNGKKNGRWTTWYNNGDIKSVIEFRDGKKDGKYIEYYRDGGKDMECIYKNDKVIKKIGEWEFEEMKDCIPKRSNEFN